MSSFKYKIVLFCNRKKVRTLYKTNSYYSVLESWREFKTEKEPSYLVEYSGGRNKKPLYEIALIGPNNGNMIKTFGKDGLGRAHEILMEDETLSIRKIYPYWREEKIYDFKTKKRIRYHVFFEELLKIKELSQIFTLNKNIFVQVDDKVYLYGNKNINDSLRLFHLLREDLIHEGRGNFIFIKDITTHQRKNLYDLLEQMGYKRSDLFKHYSY